MKASTMNGIQAITDVAVIMNITNNDNQKNKNNNEWNTKIDMAADININNNNQNDSIYNEWNSTKDMAADIYINNDSKKNHTRDNEWNTKNSANDIVVAQTAQQSSAPFDPTNHTMKNSRQPKAVGNCINNEDNGRHKHNPSLKGHTPQREWLEESHHWAHHWPPSNTYHIPSVSIQAQV